MLDLPLAPNPPALERDFLALGEGGRGPAGTLAVNNRFLERDGQPWLPVMGEFHYSRCPDAEWADELHRMRAGGVDIVASYVFWNHHEAAEGHFDWTGRRNLRRFVQLAQQAGLLFYLRPGPWVHAEARNGGLPDWLQALAPGVPLRSNDPRYLAPVQRYIGEVGHQLQGLMWRDGGPVAGVQLENEYEGHGPGRGAEHIAALKRIARDHGLVVPLWTVTGWPTLDIPAREVLPVSGAYPDGFWGGGTGPQPPCGVFAFNTGRSIGEMGNVGGTPHEGRIDPAHYPFFLAEAGGGMHVSYHRRPVVDTDDVAACALVQIGSGANLYGYYMFHGGTNPGRGLQETQASGYPNDVAELGYDFRAPLGQYGQPRPSYGRLRALHAFLAAFGPELALMDSTVAGTGDPTDLQQPRAAARAAGDSGFVFVNNHCRHHPLPRFDGFQLRLHSDSGAAQALPGTPVSLPSGAYFIWPVGQTIGSARLRHATVQPLTRWRDGTRTTWVAFAIDGVRAELAFDAHSVRTLQLPAGLTSASQAGVLTVTLSGTLTQPALLTLTDRDGQTHRVMLLSQSHADRCLRLPLRGQPRLVISEQAVHAEGDTVVLFGPGPAALQLWPADDLAGGANWASWARSADTPDTLPVNVQVLSDNQQPPERRDGPYVAWRKRRVPLAPDDAAYAGGLQLRITPEAPCPAGQRVMLTVDYVGDTARLLADAVMVDDQFADGEPWTIGIHRFLRTDGSWPTFTLQIVPADPELPIFLEHPARARLQAAAPRRAKLVGLQARVWHRTRLGFPPAPATPTWLD
jgi:hypothetical protein